MSKSSTESFLVVSNFEWEFERSPKLLKKFFFKLKEKKKQIPALELSSNHLLLNFYIFAIHLFRMKQRIRKSISWFLAFQYIHWFVLITNVLLIFISERMIWVYSQLLSVMNQYLNWNKKKIPADVENVIVICDLKFCKSSTFACLQIHCKLLLITDWKKHKL